MIRKAALITNDVVSAVILVDSDNLPKDMINQLVFIPKRQVVQVGYLYSLGSFTPPVVDYVALAARKREEVNAERKARLSKLSADIGGVLYDGDEESVRNITGILTAANAGVPIPWPIPWRDANNTIRLLKQAEAVNLAAVLLQQIQIVYNLSWYIKDTLIPQALEAGKIESLEVSDNALWSGA